jgi:hypothetical protein
MGIAANILGLGRRMSIRNAFIASIALVFGIAWLGEASAQSFLPPCPSLWPSCQGTFTWPNGETYVGEWRDGTQNGQGTYKWPNGEAYVGEWRDGTPNGQGTHTWPNGDAYVGEWRAGKKNGQGTFTRPDGREYVGEWRDDTQNGQGTFTWPDGEKHVGYWLDGRANGQGTRTLPNGAKYIGAWQAGKQHGQGKEYSSDGKLVREGYWVSNAYYGLNAPDSLSGGRVKMVESDGIYQVPVLINDELTLSFFVDSGASDVSIPSDVVLTLIRTGTIKQSDFIGTETHSFADGSTASSRTFMLRSLTVGDRRVTDVRASIANVNGPLLLGQSFLSKFESWSQDNVSHELVLQ